MAPPERQVHVRTNDAGWERKAAQAKLDLGLPVADERLIQEIVIRLRDVYDPERRSQASPDTFG
jgi:hypothetical protein